MWNYTKMDCVDMSELDKQIDNILKTIDSYIIRLNKADVIVNLIRTKILPDDICVEGEEIVYTEAELLIECDI
jgi:hypothetical protein